METKTAGESESPGYPKPLAGLKFSTARHTANIRNFQFGMAKTIVDSINSGFHIADSHSGVLKDIINNQKKNP